MHKELTWLCFLGTVCVRAHVCMCVCVCVHMCVHILNFFLLPVSESILGRGLGINSLSREGLYLSLPTVLPYLFHGNTAPPPWGWGLSREQSSSQSVSDLLSPVLGGCFTPGSSVRELVIFIPPQLDVMPVWKEGLSASPEKRPEAKLCCLPPFLSFIPKLPWHRTPVVGWGAGWRL